MLANEELSVQEAIEERIRELGDSDPAQVQAWMQFRGLIDHIAVTSDRAFKKPEIAERGFASQSLNIASYILISFLKYCVAYFQRICEIVDGQADLTTEEKIFWRHRALTHLIENWEMICPVLLAAHDPDLDAMRAVLFAAAPAKKWLHQQQEQMIQQYARYHSADYVRKIVSEHEDEASVLTLPHLGRRFGLLTFAFAPGVSVMTLPVYDMRTPWGWQVIWHEMAGHIVSQLELEGKFSGLVTRVDEAVRALSPELQETIWKDWVAAGQPQHALKIDEYDQRCRQLVGDDPQALQECKDFLAAIEGRARSSVDRAGWIAELLEDAYSAISLGPGLLSTLKYVLRQHYRDDDMLLDARHPPVRLRLAMVGAMLIEMFGLTGDDSAADPEHVTGPAASALAQSLDDELRPVSAALRPVARILWPVLVPDFIENPFDEDLYSLANKLAHGILDEDVSRESLAVSVTGRDEEGKIAKWIRALVTAARRALEMRPSEARHIGSLIEAVFGQVDVPASQRFEPPDSYFFSEILDGVINETDGSLTQILARSLVHKDEFTPELHPHHPAPVELTWWAHGEPHKILIHGSWHHT